METFSDSRPLSASDRGEFAGQTALVIGAGQAAGGPGGLMGNGRAIALTLAARGARVLCADRDLEAAQATLQAIAAAGGSGRALAVDIAQPSSIQALGRSLDDIGQPPHLLVLNAGISDRKPLAQITPEGWDRIFAVNLRGHMLCAQALVPRMAEDGAIVFVSSLAALMPAARNPAYEASKAGLSALCRAVALEGHPRGLRANVVVAGLIDTPMGRAASAARPDRAAGPLPFGHQGSAQDIAEATAFLLSGRRAGYINATELRVDGGLRHGIVRAAVQ